MLGKYKTDVLFALKILEDKYREGHNNIAKCLYLPGKGP